MAFVLFSCVSEKREQVDKVTLEQETISETTRMLNELENLVGEGSIINLGLKKTLLKHR
ncbi:MAG: hypothetical protein JKY48_15580 [Flavobacteriales bacterium]|nr:hypothetical protein [Flavobacteriales bacterium]